MKCKILLSALLIAATSKAASDEITVKVVSRVGTAEFEVPSRVRLITAGQTTATFSRVPSEAKIHVFPLDTCPDGAQFQVEIAHVFYETVEQTDKYDCEQPEVIVLAKLGNVSAAAWFTSLPGQSANFAEPPYAQRIASTLVTPTDTIVALGSQATENHALMIFAFTEGDLGTAAFFANENAALARNAGSNSLAIGYATASYDFGFRAMGVDPVTPANPLIAIDERQNRIPVLTPDGAAILRTFNNTIGTNDPGTWSNQTTSALRDFEQSGIDNNVLQLDGSAAIRNWQFETPG